ncbi:serine/threonine-protein kinase 10 isoform X2 [Plodia interpunctella]|uniref:serine/threonine-protein kinase 10 isoform X2 n=1 Tax=Plodia interpunctella TaxID=58824 RepID=UPI0023680276|nr:serine/threonine-protein kinase 10 isoform X2 [Plodia interpunctella]
MSFFNNLKKVLHLGSGHDTKKKKVFANIRDNSDPAENWDMIGELGDGAFGKVYKAQHKTTGQLAAAKMCVLDNEDDLADFTVEIDILSECRHPNVVELHEAYFIDNKLWMLLEYCDGGALDSVMAELEKGLNEQQIAYVCREMCRGLEFLHSQKVIHRDLKAGNVLATMSGGVKLADFGVSAKNKSTLQKHDTFIGTPYWMAPEVVLCETFRDNPYDFKVDIWSLGITLIEFAQVEPPNHEMTPMRVLLKIQKSPPPTLEHPAAWSPAFNDIIACALVKDPEKRPTASQLLQHAFVRAAPDARPLRALLLEFRAEVVEEELLDDDAENKLRRGKTKLNKEQYQRIASEPELQPRGRPPASKEHRSSQMHMEMEDDSTSVRSGDTPDVKMSDPEPAAGATPQPPPAARPRSPPAGSLPPAPAPAPAAVKRRGEDGGAADKNKPAPKKEKGPAPPPPASPPASPQSDPGPHPPAAAPSPPTHPTHTTHTTQTTQSKKPPAPPPPQAVGKLIVDQVCREAEKAVENKTDISPDKTPKESEPAELTRTPTELTRTPAELTQTPAEPTRTPGEQTRTPAEPTQTPAELTRTPAELTRTPAEHTRTPAELTRTPSLEIIKEKSNSIDKVDRIDKDNRIKIDGLAEIKEMKRNSEEKTSIAEKRRSFADKINDFKDSNNFIDEHKVLHIKDDIRNEKNSSFEEKRKSLEQKFNNNVERHRNSFESTISVEERVEKRLEDARNSILLDKSNSVGEIVEKIENDRRISDNRDVDGIKVNVEVNRVENRDDKIRSQQNLVEVRPVTPSKEQSSAVVVVPSSVVVFSPNSLGGSGCGLVTVTTTHPPVLANSAELPPHAVTISTTPPIADEVVVISAGCSSDEDCVAPSSLDSLDEKRGRRLDSSEVLILSPGAADSGVFDDSGHHAANLDTSHVSVVTVDNEQVRVVDSHNAQYEKYESRATTRLSVDSTVHLGHSDSGSLASSSSRAAADADADSLAESSHHANGGSRVNTEHQVVENGEPVVLRRKQEQPNRIQRSKEDVQLANLRKKTRKRTRKFEIDGVVVTTTTSKVIWGDEESGRTWDDHALRKQELREIKMLQKQEQKQFQDLNAKETQLREQQDKRFEAEQASLSRAHASELETLARAQRASAERAELQLEAELRLALKRLRAEHERDLRHFRDTLKQELRLLKQEVELVAKDRRKEAYRQRRVRLDAEHAEREKAFVASLAEASDSVLRRIHDNHRDRQALADRQYLQQRQQIMRTREAAFWELEEKQIHERHQLAKRQIKEEFLLRRHQMLVRHDKELDQIRRKNTRKEEELAKCQALEKRSLPKRIRAEQKAREMMFRESLRISAGNADPHRDKLKKFQENEKRRYRAEHERLATKHAKAREELRAAGEALLRELEQYQNEKRKALTNHESNKIKAAEERYSSELREWRAKLGSRKMKLIEEFRQQLLGHERKFGQTIEDKASYLDVEWPKNVLQHVLSAYHQRQSFMGSLSRSRTSLNLISASNTPHMNRRRSISPVKKRDKLTKAQKFGSTSNLKLVSEKVSGFSVFSGSDPRRAPIMAYDDVPKEMSTKVIQEPTSLDRSYRKHEKINKQSVSEHLFRHLENHSNMKRSISQQSLKQDVALEAVVIDLPSLEESRYDTMKSTSTIGTDSRDGSEIEFDRGLSRWGQFRGSNSYSNSDLPVGQLSTLNLKRTIVNEKNEDSVV